jgi:hypothetical protein
MRLRIKKLLRGGEYFVSFESMDFNQEEMEKIDKFGMPSVDFISDGLGTHRLNEIDASLKCQTVDEANQIIESVAQNIKDRLIELMAQVDNFSGEEVVEL